MTPFKNIPKVDRVLEWPQVAALLEIHPRPVVVTAVRRALDVVRRQLATNLTTPPSFDAADIFPFIMQELSALVKPRLRRVVNGTGVVIHTNLGRAPLPKSFLTRIGEIACSYTNLEFDLEKGARGTRYAHVEPLLCELTGAEAALIVNNNAAAVMLALASLAPGKEVVVSRGELVEIGGSFRIPDVMKMSGALLREVGTTNRTHPRDYTAAISPDTGLLLKVHTSNFAVVGFTAEVSPAELAKIGTATGIPVMADAGSGVFIDLSPYGISGEPTIQEYVAAGVDVVTFSGDKMLGAGQAGIIVGKKSYIEPMKKHPLLRALRVDKFTLAALEDILLTYRDGQKALTDIPTLRMLTLSADELHLRAKNLTRRIRRSVPGAHVKIVSDFSQVGGGAHPLLRLPTALIAISFAGISADALEAKLRTTATPVIGRITRDQFLIDLRTLLDDDIPLLIAALDEALSS